MRTRLLAILSAVSLFGALAVSIPSNAAAGVTECAPAWSSSASYNGGGTVSDDGHNWSAKWWTQNQKPGTSPVWTDRGGCGSTNPEPSCTHPAWAANTPYYIGDVVKLADGSFFRAKQANPGYDPVAATWFWEPYICVSDDFVVSEAQFEQMFPNRNPFYTYAGLTEALHAYPGFTNTGSDVIKKREAAAFLGNINHESGGLKYIVEQNTANYPLYCDATQPYGCPAGQAAYYGRGPIQLSWNFNYKTVGDLLGLDLLNNPYLVEQDPAVAWMTALWYWNTQTGPGTVTGHDAIVRDLGFGESIRSINGALECDGGNPRQVENRIASFKNFSDILGVTYGDNLSC
ncbi:glycoside hydrolase family 19 protein [Embleya sp. NPDC050154]|uniref:glycoside hydrolase family 19 protein n=1 Tax=unclassified Embleya TaxID=2699296 RepID=UPI0037BCAE84